MATPEQEELRLIVSLNDQASAGLQQLRTTFAQTFSTQNIAQLDRFKRSNEDLTKQIKELSTPEELAEAKKVAEESKEASKALSRAGQEAGDALERGAGKLNKWLGDFDRWYNERFGKGIYVWRTLRQLAWRIAGTRS